MFKKPIIKYSGNIPQPTLKKGSVNSRVKDLQKFLNWYLSGKLVVDGEFGKKTESALKSFQKYESLVKDGIYGEKSYARAKSYKKQEEKSKVSEVNVVDVSYWNHSIDWAKVKKDNISGAILRTSYTTQKSFSLNGDSTFKQNIINSTKNGIKVGDCVAFAGEIYPYKRKNGTYDLGIKNPDMVKKIDSYELPSDEELYEQFKQQIKCETCLFSEQCYGICII